MTATATQTVEAVTPSLRKLAIRGSAWTLAGLGAGQFLRLGSNLVMTRLLFPEAFGLMALVTAFLVGLQMFSDIGIGPSVVQHERGDEPAFYNTAFTMQAIRGVVLWLASCVIAVPAAMFYEQPVLGVMLPVACLSSIIQGFQSTAFVSLHRRMALGKVTLLLTGSIAVRIVVMIAWAMVWPNVWSLVAGHLTESLIRTVASHFMMPEVRNRFCWDKAAAHDMFRYGRWIFFSTLFTFFAAQADRFMLGKLIAVEMLGVYMVAVVWAMMPIEVLNRIGDSVLFPMCSRMKAAGRDLLHMLDRVRRPVTVGGALLVGGTAVLGSEVIDLLYDPRYHDAGPILQVMAAVVWFEVLSLTPKCVLFALGNSYWGALGNGIKLACMIVLGPLGYRWWGIEGVVIGVAAAQAARHAVFLFGMHRVKLPCLRDDVLATIMLVGSIVLGTLVGDAVVRAGAHHLAGHTLSLTIMILCWAPAVWRLRHVLTPQTAPTVN